MPKSSAEIGGMSMSDILDSYNLTSWRFEADAILNRFVCQEYEPASQVGVRHIGAEEASSAAKNKALIEVVEKLQFQNNILEGLVEKPVLISKERAIEIIRNLSPQMAAAQELNDATPALDVLMGDIPTDIIDQAKNGCRTSRDFLNDIQEVRKNAIAQICRAKLSVETDVSEISAWQYAQSLSFSQAVFSVLLGHRNFYTTTGAMPETTFLTIRGTYIRRNLKFISGIHFLCGTAED